MLVPIGIAARALSMSRERLKQLADAGRVSVVKDTLGRRFVDEQELRRLLDDREAARKSGTRR